jgi:hypothetical protein
MSDGKEYQLNTVIMPIALRGAVNINNWIRYYVYNIKWETRAYIHVLQYSLTSSEIKLEIKLASQKH